ncbi:MAG: AMP-dependent synthetase/ligase [Pyrinomonadaceae bacterium]
MMTDNISNQTLNYQTTVPNYNSAPPRVPLHDDEPKTLVEMFEQVARQHNRADALNFKSGDAWHSISSAEFLTRARAIALGLYTLGVRRGDRVALLSENRPEWTLSDAGCQCMGVIDVPIYPTQALSQVCYILNDSQARVLVIQHHDAYARIKDAIEDCGSIEKIVFFDTPPDLNADARFMTLTELETRGRGFIEQQPALVNELARGVQSEDLATIIYTSGTTGEPKGVMLTNANLVSNFIDVSAHLTLRTDDVALSLLPLSHIFERTGMYMFLYHGIPVYYAESIDQLGANIREVRPTLMNGVPRIFEKIYGRAQETAIKSGGLKSALFTWAIDTGKAWAQAKLNGHKISLSLSLQHKLADRLVLSKIRTALGGRFRFCVAGGAALSPDIGYIFAGAQFPILQCYGLTETSPGLTVNDLASNRIETVGRPARNVEIRIAADGEIEARGPNIMRGYYNKPDATRECFTSDGWFKTGDIGALDEDGYLKITDRKKELFKTSGGKYLAPQPIEQQIKLSRFVNQVVLIVNGRKFPAALIVPNWAAVRSYVKLKNIDVTTDDEICRHPRVVDVIQRQIDKLCADLGKYERVKRIALLPHELTIEGGELTPTLKVKRRVIDEKYASVINGIYAAAEAEGHKAG